MLDSTAAVAAERQGKNARQLLEAVALETGDSAMTGMEIGSHQKYKPRPNCARIGRPGGQAGRTAH